MLVAVDILLIVILRLKKNIKTTQLLVSFKKCSTLLPKKSSPLKLSLYYSPPYSSIEPGLFWIIFDLKIEIIHLHRFFVSFYLNKWFLHRSNLFMCFSISSSECGVVLRVILVWHYLIFCLVAMSVWFWLTDQLQLTTFQSMTWASTLQIQRR